jgi:hypothetical protein
MALPGESWSGPVISVAGFGSRLAPIPFLVLLREVGMSLNPFDLAGMPLSMGNKTKGILMHIHPVPYACFLGTVYEVYPEVSWAFLHVADHLGTGTVEIRQQVFSCLEPS